MKQEHCELYGHDVQFTTSNYGITTTPQDEYQIATGKKQCPKKDTMNKDGKFVRVIKKIKDLQELPQSIDAGLLFIEILALVSCASS